MKKEAVEIYKNIVIWVSLFLAVSCSFNEIFFGETGEGVWLVLDIFRSIIVLFTFFGLMIYSIIMLVYILAKRKVEEYIFGFAVPFLLIIIPFIIEMFTNRNAPPQSLTYVIFLAILFLYSLYHKWKT